MRSTRWLALSSLVLCSFLSFAQAPNIVTFTVNGISGGLNSEATSTAVVGDFDRDGFVDFAAADANGQDLVIGSGLNINGGPTFFDFQTVELGTDELITADFNHDGILDLAASGESQFVRLFRGN